MNATSDPVYVKICFDTGECWKMRLAYIESSEGPKPDGIPLTNEVQCEPIGVGDASFECYYHPSELMLFADTQPVTPGFDPHQAAIRITQNERVVLDATAPVLHRRGSPNGEGCYPVCDFWSMKYETSLDASGPEEVAGASGSSGTAGAAGSAGSVLAGSAGESGSAGAVSGNAGAAGNSGTSGAAGTGNSSLPEDQQWMLDESLWTPVPQAAFANDCAVSTIDKEHDGFPAFVWESCGTGCQKGDIVQGYGPYVSIAEMVTRYYSDGPHVEVSIRYGFNLPQRWHRLQRHLDATTGNDISTLQWNYPPSPSGSPFCRVSLYTHSTGVGLEALPLQDGSGQYKRFTTGHLNTETAQWTWASPEADPITLPAAWNVFDIALEGGKMFFVGGGTVSVQTDLTKNVWELLESPSDSGGGAGEGDQALWFALNIVNDQIVVKIKSWTPATGIVQLTDTIPKRVYAMDVSKDSIVAVMEDPYTGDSVTKFSFWASPRTTSAAGVVPRISPTINLPDIGEAYPSVKTAGDYLAFPVTKFKPDDPTTGEAWFFVVARLSDWSMWRIPLSTGALSQSLSAFAIDNTYLYLAEDADSGSDVDATNLIRYDLSQLDSYATKIPPLLGGIRWCALSPLAGCVGMGDVVCVPLFPRYAV